MLHIYIYDISDLRVNYLCNYRENDRYKINITLKVTRKSDKREEKLDLLFLVKVTIFSTFPNLVNI